jgi:virginiamycin B lyase
VRSGAALLALALLASAASFRSGGGSVGGSIVLFRRTAIAGPIAITVGPDRAMWFTSERTRSVGRMTTQGSVSVHATSVTPGAVTLGPDGAVWFVDGSSTLTRVGSDGLLTDYPAVAAVRVASGPDGDLWFTTGGKYVARMTTSGSVTLINDPQRLRGTYGIARGPGGAMWVTNYLGSSIARIDMSGAVTAFTAPCLRYPTGITAGPDGALWFADDSGTIGRITTAGQISCFGDAALDGHPDAIVSSGGALWAADRNGSIVRATTHGTLTRYTSSAMRYPDSIAAGPNGTVWFTDYLANAIGRIRANAPPAKPASPAPLPRVTLISDSVAASIAFDTGAKSILANGVDLFLEPGEARTLGPGPAGGIAPPTVLDLIAQLGHRLGPTVVVEIGNNDYPAQYAANMEAALAAFSTAGVRHVLWTTLHVTPAHTSYSTINAVIAAAAARHPELTVLDWNAYATPHPEWFQSDGVHLTGYGPRALAQFIHAGLVRLGIPIPRD